MADPNFPPPPSPAPPPAPVPAPSSPPDDGTRDSLSCAKARAEIAKLEAETEKLRRDDARAEALQALERRRLEREIREARRWYLRPAFIASVAPVLAALVAFGPQIVSLKAIYNKALLDAQRTFLTDRVQWLGEKEKELSRIQTTLTNDNRRLAAENEQLAISRDQLARSNVVQQLALDRLRSDLATVSTTLESARTDLRSKELELVAKDRAQAESLGQAHLRTLKGRTPFEFGWEKEPADLLNLLRSGSSNDVRALLASVALSPTNTTPLLSRYAAAFVLYQDQDGPDAARWRERLLELVNESFRTEPMLPLLAFYTIDYAPGTSLPAKPGVWRSGDGEAVWRTYFTLVTTPGRRDSRDYVVIGIGHGVANLAFARPDLLRQLLREFPEAKRVFRDAALDELKVSSESASTYPALSGLATMDPALLAVLAAERLASLPEPLASDFTRLPSRAWSPILQILAYGDTNQVEGLQRIGAPPGPKPDEPPRFALAPASWREWLARPQGQELLAAARAPELGSWESLTSNRGRQ